MFIQESLSINTPGRGMIEITDKIAQCVRQAKKTVGLCHVFLHHTSASLILCENADAIVQDDLERFMQALIRDGDSLFQHIAEGPDDMPSHIRTVLTSSFLMIPIAQGELKLGTWQGIYLWEHRYRGHRRHVTVTINAE